MNQIEIKAYIDINWIINKEEYFGWHNHWMLKARLKK
jgi:hypothetical protein